MKEPQCPAQDANGEGSASSTTSTSQESGQTRSSTGQPWDAPLEMVKDLIQGHQEAKARKAKHSPESLNLEGHSRQDHEGEEPVFSIDLSAMGLLLDRLDQMIELQREGNSLLLALIEALGEDPDPEELHIPRPL